MKFGSWDKNSIIFRLTSFVILIIILQAVILIGILIAGGVLSQGQAIAYNSFYEKVNNRKDYIQREMKNRWTNMDIYVSEISKTLSSNKSNDVFLKEAANQLISMLRTTQTTGAFIILDNGKSLGEEHQALYIRDYDPLLNDYSNKDLYLVAGSSDLAKNINIPLDEEWKYNMKMEAENRDFYEKPYQKASLSSNSNLLGYWSKPFSVFPKDIQIITYSMPLFDSDNVLRGIIGVEVSLSYINQFLPPGDLQLKDSLGYLIGYKGGNSQEISPIVMNGAFQKRMIPSNKAFSLKNTDLVKKIYLINNSNSKENIYACVEKIGLYSHNTPFEGEEWYIIGMMSENNLFNYVMKIKRILWMSLSLSIVIGVGGGYIISYGFTKPIIKLAKQVKESDKDKVINLEATGLSEVDELSRAMVFANNTLLESTIKMSRIIDLVEVPIGAFEYRDDAEHVFVTDQLQLILDIEEEEIRKIITNKSLFIEKINEILNKPELEEEQVYILGQSQKKWVKIKTVISGKSTLGVVMDVTKEIEEKKEIKQDRDLDPLTKIFNRKALQRYIEDIIYKGEDFKSAAILMFDLDNLKGINDTYGHKWGDLYIKASVEQLKQIGGTEKVLGRRSGDEFVLFLYGYPSREAIKACVEAFYQNLKNQPLVLPDGKVKPVTISAGLMWVEGSELTYDELLNMADEALYKAKKLYKGTCYENI